MSKHDDDSPTDDASLRRRAEQQIKSAAPEGAARTDVETARLLHELQVHQIELALQNDELRLAQTRVEALLAQYTDLYDFAPVGYITLDRTGTVRHVNLVGARMLDIERSRLVGRRFGLFIGPDDRQPFNDFLERLFASGVRQSCDVSPPRKGLERLVVRLEGTSTSDGTSCRVVMVDITERKQAEEALALQAAALNAAANAITICDRTGAIEWVNTAFTELTGHASADVIGRSPDDLLRSGKHDDAFYQELWETVRSGRPWEGELTNRRKDGSEYIEGRTVTPVLDARGRIAHYITIAQDFTERRRLEAQLLHTQRMETVGQLAGGIAHDFNNLLTVINGTADLALQRMRKDDPLQQDLREIEQAGERAASLTRQLLAFSRKQVMKFVPVDIGVLLVDIRSMLQRLIGERTALEVVVRPGTGVVLADPMQIGHVVMNLAVNARDAMPNGGTLTMEVSNIDFGEDFAAGHPSVKPGRYVKLTVSDTGLGMDEATVGRIFEPFFTTKEIGQGTGLGLSTVYGIVRQSSGNVWAYSQLDKGTTITICLPRIDTPPAIELLAAPALALAPGAATVLIVEDEAGVLKLAKRVLDLAGWTVLTARNGAEALDLLARHRGTVDVVLTDIVMPVMGGLELGQRLRKGFPKIRVLYMSGYSNDLVTDDTLIDASRDFLGKPFSAAQLTEKVRSVLEP